jgi:hypothetical protein
MVGICYRLVYGIVLYGMAYFGKFWSGLVSIGEIVLLLFYFSVLSCFAPFYQFLPVWMGFIGLLWYDLIWLLSLARTNFSYSLTS